MKKILLTLLVTILFASFGSSNAQAASTFESSLPCINYKELYSLSIDETYTYDEVLADMLHCGVLSKNDIQKFKETHISTIRANSSDEIRYSKFTMDPYTFKTKVFGSEYKLTPIFYCGLLYINGGYEPSKIVSLEGGHIYTGAGLACIFGGSVFYKLEAGNSFYYGVFGDVYETGTTTTKAGVKIGIGESTTATFEFSYSSNFLKNVDFDGRYLSAGLDP